MNKSDNTKRITLLVISIVVSLIFIITGAVIGTNKKNTPTIQGTLFTGETTITTNGSKYVYYRITPLSGNYKIESISGYDTEAILYRADDYDDDDIDDWDKLIQNDDDGAGLNFSITYYFEYGYIYYLAVHMRTGNQSVPIKINISYVSPW